MSGSGAGCRADGRPRREASTARAPLPPDALPYLRGGARLLAPVSLCAPPISTRYKLPISCPACLLSNYLCVVCGHRCFCRVEFFSRLQHKAYGDASGATRCRARVQYTLVHKHCTNKPCNNLIIIMYNARIVE